MATEIEVTMDRKTDRTSAAVRRFTLLDGMTLVAASACGLAVDGWFMSYVTNANTAKFLDFMKTYFATKQYPLASWCVMAIVFPVVGAWTLALIPLRLKKPRPSLRHLGRQPGWIASCGFLLGLAFAGVIVAGAMFVRLSQSADWPEMLPFLSFLFGPAIVAGWMTLILGRHWKPEPSWIDRLGRVLGVFWIVMAVVGPIVGVKLFL